ncbi:conserved hypothetical protein [Candidatus Terasakiella magnetica]|uniref:Uncharacterized protein n=1 Tax=Candidatus Terasakiella magnetica TaxID=1867952 RepID=A0A1C3RFT8_9PROT|nr:hypothetical protein [Candidatus Terasakiella magnetica]SCA56082.1 conserved hypothetical protein [Candidatus Terasakiella magnetica]
MVEGISPEFETCQAKVKGTNINEETLLATDYLNHFNEVVMMIDMLPDMPDCLDMVKDWQPKPYKDHFRDSTIADKDLAVDVYDHAMPFVRKAFEDTISKVDAAIFQAISDAEAAIETGDMEFLRFKVSESATEIHRLQDRLSAIIHGTADLSGEMVEEEDQITMDQNDIDALFD